MEDVDAVLITHEHIDHVAGLGVLARKYGIHIYATRGTIEGTLSMKQVGEISFRAASSSFRAMSSSGS